MLDVGRHSVAGICAQLPDLAFLTAPCPRWGTPRTCLRSDRRRTARRVVPPVEPEAVGTTTTLPDAIIDRMGI